MANRAYLVTTDTSSPVVPGQATEALCAASYMLPVFWVTLFNTSSIVTTSEGRDGSAPHSEGEALTYPYLLTPCAAGLARSRERWPALERLIGSSHRELFETWHGFLERQQKGFFHCETLELAWMSEHDPDEFPRTLRAMVGCFSGPAPASVSDLVGSQFSGWDLLFSQAAVDPTQPAEIRKECLCGYYWSIAVPWEPPPLTDFAL